RPMLWAGISRESLSKLSVVDGVFRLMTALLIQIHSCEGLQCPKSSCQTVEDCMTDLAIALGFEFTQSPVCSPNFKRDQQGQTFSVVESLEGDRNASVKRVPRTARLVVRCGRGVCGCLSCVWP